MRCEFWSAPVRSQAPAPTTSRVGLTCSNFSMISNFWLASTLARCTFWMLRWTGIAHSRFKSLDDRHDVGGACLLHRLLPLVPGDPDLRRRIGDDPRIRILLPESFEERLVLRRFQGFEIGVGDDDALGLFGRQDFLLIAQPEDRRDDRDGAVKAGGGKLPVEGYMVAADEVGHDRGRLGRLDLTDGRAEIRNLERNKLDAGYLNTGFFRQCLSPCGCHVTVNIVRRDHVECIAGILRRPLDQRPFLLHAVRSLHEAEAVALAALVDGGEEK